MSQQRSEQYLQSSHTHEQPLAGLHSSLLCRQELQGLQDCNPMGLPVKNTHRHRETSFGEKHCLEKWSSFQVQNWNRGCIDKRNLVEKNMLIIDCQPVLNIVQLSCYLQLSPKFFPQHCSICWCSLRTVWPTFIMLDVILFPLRPYSILLHHLRCSRDKG